MYVSVKEGSLYHSGSSTGLVGVGAWMAGRVLVLTTGGAGGGVFGAGALPLPLSSVDMGVGMGMGEVLVVDEGFGVRTDTVGLETELDLTREANGYDC